MSNTLELNTRQLEARSNNNTLPTEKVLRIIDERTEATLYFAWSLDGSGAVYFDTAEEVLEQLGVEV